MPDPRDYTPEEMRTLARMPPEELLDLRKVYQGQTPSTPGQIAVKALLDSKPREFLSQLRQAEKDWRANVAALDLADAQAAAAKRPADSGESASDPNTVLVLDTIDRLLEACERDAKEKGQAPGKV